ncbi:SU(VAR)3-9 homolog 5 [Prunus dulcis]|uniref:SU(VAR)3-9 homolog 5 n=1 Tax=Prunus dulcis TaxID=3755 RepID=A0A4Y1RE94_PRUDU|nr:SU(VAR)3-9 homolog 5 [Prunus dulcis]
MHCEGGNPRVCRKKPKDKKLECRNLALKNSMEAEIHKSYFTTYVYDGLYKVEYFWQEREEFDTLMFKFLLTRIAGQPIITWGKVSGKSK